jgi:hypothetical protein
MTSQVYVTKCDTNDDASICVDTRPTNRPACDILYDEAVIWKQRIYFLLW